MLYAGYTIVATLLPVGASSNAVMRRAWNIAQHDPAVHAYFGEGAKAYGLDPGGRAEGRRNFVPEYHYDDPLTGEPMHRVKFNLEGERGRKAWVYAEVNGNGDFRYLIVATKEEPRPRRVISIIDNRPPDLSEEERQSRVCRLLREAEWSFFADNKRDAEMMEDQLGGWRGVQCIRCDESPERCEAAGVSTNMGALPLWKGVGAAAVQPLPADALGVKSLRSMEKLVLPLANPKSSWLPAWAKLW